MYQLNKIGHFSQKKVNLRFETEMEKMFHKVISAMRFGEKVEIDVDGTNENVKKDALSAIKKSCLYNNVEVYYRWSKDKTKIILIIEGF
jgi:phosphoribosylformylglycinamidine (FGAM) synthase PurS component